MELSKYDVFLKVVEKGSFSAAAEELGYSPSGLNRMMSALETELDLPVFNRNKKGICLTHNGEQIIEYIRKMVYWERQLKEYIAEVKGLETGHLNVGTIYSFASTLLPDLVRRFRAIYPNITISIMQGGHQELSTWLEEGKADLIFTTGRGQMENWVTLKKDPMVVWVSKDHPFASKPFFPWNRIEKEPFILTMAGHDTDTEFFAKENDLKLNIQYSSRDYYTTYRMVEAGLGISMNNLMMTQHWSGEVVVLPLKPEAYVEMGIQFPRHRSLSAKKFFECIGPDELG